MLVCGSGEAAAYDPATKSWERLPDGPAADAEVVWTGRELVAIGGYSASAYNPATRQWLPLPTPPGGITYRVHHRMVWTGEEVIFFGGRNGGDILADGATFRPSPS